MTFREALDLAEKQNEWQWQDTLVLWAGILTFCAFLFIILAE